VDADVDRLGDQGAWRRRDDLLDELAYAIEHRGRVVGVDSGDPAGVVGVQALSISRAEPSRISPTMMRSGRKRIAFMIARLQVYVGGCTST
jgi:hypothetical protein